MARYKGHNGEALVGASAIGEIESFELELTAASMPANVMGSAWTDVEAGQFSATGTVSVLRDPADAGQAALVLGTKITATFYPEGDTASLTEITGQFMVTSIGISVSVGDLVKSTYNLENAGTITIGTVAA